MFFEKTWELWNEKNKNKKLHTAVIFFVNRKTASGGAMLFHWSFFSLQCTSHKFGSREFWSANCCLKQFVDFCHPLEKIPIGNINPAAPKLIHMPCGCFIFFLLKEQKIYIYIYFNIHIFIHIFEQEISFTNFIYVPLEEKKL